MIKSATAGLLLAAATAAQARVPAPFVQIDAGQLRGVPEYGVIAFKGIPYAAPPVGDLRWKPPQPVQPWQGVRAATSFGNRPMQLPLFSDMVFRSPGISEDCLYLNVWAPRAATGKKLPVLVYFHGGGLAAGDGSEPRYDGAPLAQQGIVALTVNYRLGVFGFLAHPALTAESPDKASGNYGLMDQAAALDWVRRNIAAFGGDPQQVTIAGESAGSYSVSAQMVMPRSKGLFARAIGESGSVLGGRGAPPLAEAEKQGAAFAQAAGLATLKDLRAAPADQLLQAQGKPGAPWFGIVTDGLVIARPPLETFAQGRQAKVPLLAGWNSQEQHWRGLLRDAQPTAANFRAALQKLYGEQADEVARLYGGDVTTAARDLASDRWIAYGTWKWIDLQARAAPTWRYYYAHPRPATVDGKPAEEGATHSGEIEYAMNNLDGNKVFKWSDDDRQVSATMHGYFVNFIKKGDPNGADLPAWPQVTQAGASVMRLDVQSGAYDPQDRARYEFHDRQADKP